MDEAARDGVIHGHDQRIALLEGMKQVARLVGGGLGPAGWRLLAERPADAPELMLDGAAQADALTLDDPVEELGANLLRQVARGVHREIGDGTATAVLLAFEIYRGAVRAVTAGSDPEEIAEGIRLGAALAGDAISALARPANLAELRRVATLAAEGDPVLGYLCASALEAPSRDLVEVEIARRSRHEDRLEPGWSFDAEMVQPAPSEGAIRLHRPRVVICDSRELRREDLERWTGRRHRPALVIAPSLDPSAAAELAAKNAADAARLVLVVPAGDMAGHVRLALLAAWTGAAILHPGGATEPGGGAGRIRHARVDARRVSLFGPRRLPVSSDGGEEIPNEDRAVLLRVAAPTDSEAVLRAAMARKALAAVRAARRSGIVPGGGIAYLQVADMLRKVDAEPGVCAGIALVSAALEEPLWRLATHQGATGRHVIRQIRDSDYQMAFDARSGQVESRDELRLLDPADTLRSALRHAASVAGAVSLVEVAVVHRSRAEMD